MINRVPHRLTTREHATPTVVAICTWSSILLGGVALLSACENANLGPVDPPAPSGSIAITAPDSVISVNGTMVLTAAVLDASGNEVPGEPVSWSSANESIAYITTDGVLVGVTQGTTTVTASVASMSATESFEVWGHAIGAAGGQATSRDGNAWVDIPPGALSQSASITIAPSDESGFSGDPGYVSGSGYEFGPSGQGFLGTIRLNVVYNPALIPAGVSESSLRVNRLVNGSWSPLPGATIDVATNTVSGATSSFSTYGVVGSTGASPPPTNTAPVATIQAPSDGSSVITGTSVTFQGSGQDAEDGTLPDGSLSWNSSIDGDMGSGSSIATSSLSLGTHRILLTVFDSDAVTATDEITLDVTDVCSGSNTAPVVTINSPSNGAEFEDDDDITFNGSAADVEDGSLTGAALVWTSDLSGQIGTGTSFQIELSAGQHQITLTARDSCGATGMATITVLITED